MKTPAKRRMIVFMTGFDPAGPDRYNLMLRQQTRYYSRRFGMKLSLGDYEASHLPERLFARTTLRAEWPEGETEIIYRIADWQDSVHQMAARGFWKRCFTYLYWYMRGWQTGSFGRILKWQKKFAIVFSVPLILLIARLAIVLLATLALALPARFAGMPTWSGAAAGAAIGIYAVFYARSYFSKFYENHLADTLTYQCDLAAKGNREVAARAAAFAGEIMADIDAENPDEILLIAHSLGSFHSLPMHEALLTHCRDKAGGGPALIHITLGSLLPFALIYRYEKVYRACATRLLMDPACRWIEYFAPQDPFSVPFIRIDRDFGLDLPQKIRAFYDVRSAVFGEVFGAKKLKNFKYNPLRMHFQYLAANDMSGAYDFFRMITHPDAFHRNLILER